MNLGTSLSAAQEDLESRLRPAPQAVEHALALLKAEPRAELAYIPMYLPGKEHGWWQIGQEVVTVTGAVLIGVNSFEAAGGIPSGSWARDMASRIARVEMDTRKLTGQAAYAVVRRTEHVAVFEDVL